MIFSAPTWGYLAVTAGETGGLANPDGIAAQLVEVIALFPAALAVIWIVQALVYSFRREWRLPMDAGFSPSVAVVVPACNEELLIGASLEALLKQDYPNFEIHVVSDGSTDRTAEIARTFSQNDVVVHELRQNVGKSMALQGVLNGLTTELFMVVDADTIPAPGAIQRMVQQFADPRVGGVTGNPRVGHVSNLLTALQSMEYAVVVSLAKRADQFWGGLYTVSGAAACFRTRALKDVGGWSRLSVTEDIEISWRLQGAGWLLNYEPRAVFYIQTPRRLRALYRQRTRWAQGLVEVARLHWRAPARPGSGLLPIAGQVVASTAWMISMALYFGYALTDAALGGGGATPPGLAADAGSQLLVWTIGLFALQALCAGVLDSAHVGRRWMPLLLAPLFPIYFWVVVYPSFCVGASRGALGRLGREWKRTERAPIAG